MMSRVSDGYIKKSKAIADIKEYANTHAFNSFHKGMIKACEILTQIPPEDRPQEESILQDTIQRLERVIKHGAAWNGKHSVSAEDVLNWLKGADDE